MTQKIYLKRSGGPVQMTTYPYHWWLKQTSLLRLEEENWLFGKNRFLLFFLSFLFQCQHNTIKRWSKFPDSPKTVSPDFKARTVLICVWMSFLIPSQYKMPWMPGKQVITFHVGSVTASVGAPAASPARVSGVCDHPLCTTPDVAGAANVCRPSRQYVLQYCRMSSKGW